MYFRSISSCAIRIVHTEECGLAVLLVEDPLDCPCQMKRPGHYNQSGSGRNATSPRQGLLDSFGEYDVARPCEGSFAHNGKACGSAIANPCEHYGAGPAEE